MASCSAPSRVCSQRRSTIPSSWAASRAVHQANQHFDDAFLHHVTAEVGSFAELATGAADAGNAMNGPITEDEVLEAMLDLNTMARQPARTQASPMNY